MPTSIRVARERPLAGSSVLFGGNFSNADDMYKVAGKQEGGSINQVGQKAALRMALRRLRAGP